MLRLVALVLVTSASLAAAPAALAQSQAEMNAEACARRDAADRTLNVVYRKAVSDLSGYAAAQRLLRDAQRAWIAFRDAEVAALFPVPAGSTAGVEYGSMYTFLYCGSLTRLTADRTAQLRAREVSLPLRP